MVVVVVVVAFVTGGNGVVVAARVSCGYYGCCIVLEVGNSYSLARPPDCNAMQCSVMKWNAMERNVM